MFISGGDAKQWLSSFGVEREYMEVQGAGVCGCAREKQRGENNLLILQKCKAC